jgi:hypothetical protein
MNDAREVIAKERVFTRSRITTLLKPSSQADSGDAHKRTEVVHRLCETLNKNDPT